MLTRLGTALVASLCFTYCSAVWADDASQAPAEAADLQPIFNGQDLTGWDGDTRMWSVTDGVIRGETTPQIVANGNTFLIWTGGKTGDFELRLSYRCNDTNNSGIQYRSSRVTEGVRNDWVLKGYQHELRNEIKFPNIAGFIYDERGSRGRICLVGEKAVWDADGKRVEGQLIDEAGFQELFRLNDWNDVVIIATGNHIRHYLNGKLILDFTDNDPERKLLDGHLGLQLHAGKPMWVEFKNIRFAQR